MKHILILIFAFGFYSANGQDSIATVRGKKLPFTGTQARVFNVMDYGAMHDGVTNDQTAIQAAINACFTAGGGTVYFPNGVYILSGALVTSVSGTNPNCQLYIPSVSQTSSLKVDITLEGESTNIFGSGYLSVIVGALPTTGAILKSTITGSGTYPAVIGTIGTTGNFANYNYSTIKINNISTRTYTAGGTVAPTLTGINMRYAAAISMDNCAVTTDTANQVTVSPVNSEVAGVVISGLNLSLIHI